MNAIFPGRIALDDGDAVDVALTVDGAELRLATPAADIGSWPLVSCRLDELGPGRYRLTVDDDFVDFSPTDPANFAAFLAGLSGPERAGEGSGRDPAVSAPAGPVSTSPVGDPSGVSGPGSGGDVGRSGPADHPIAFGDLPLPAVPGDPDLPAPGGADDAAPLPAAGAHGPSVAPGGPVSAPDDPAPVSDREPSVADTIVAETRVRERPTLPRPVLLVAGGVVLVLVLLVVALTGGSSGDESPDPTVPAAAPPPSAAADPGSAAPDPAPAPAVPAADGSVFGVPVGDAVAAWNGLAAPISPALRMDVVPAPGPFAVPLAAGVSLSGTVAADGTLDELVVEVDGAEGIPPLGLQALGVGVAVAEPGLDGPARADMLASLGLDVSAPVADGLDARILRPPASFHLVAAAGRITLSLGPA